MPKLTELNSEYSQQVTYKSADTTSAMRMGGISPVPPHYRGKHQRHFATLQFADFFYLSIFYSFDVRGDDADRDILDHNNQLLYPCDLIHAVVSKPEHNFWVADCVLSDVSCHEIEIGPVTLDTDVSFGDIRIPRQESKLGGRPFIDNLARNRVVFDEALAMGFQQVAQFETPNPRTHPEIKAFPWDPGWLHVFFATKSSNDLEFAFVIQQ